MTKITAKEAKLIASQVQTAKQARDKVMRILTGEELNEENKDRIQWVIDGISMHIESAVQKGKTRVEEDYPVGNIQEINGNRDWFINGVEKFYQDLGYKVTHEITTKSMYTRNEKNETVLVDVFHFNFVVEW